MINKKKEKSPKHGILPSVPDFIPYFPSYIFYPPPHHKNMRSKKFCGTAKK